MNAYEVLQKADSKTIDIVHISNHIKSDLPRIELTIIFGRMTLAKIDIIAGALPVTYTPALFLSGLLQA